MATIFLRFGSPGPGGLKSLPEHPSLMTADDVVIATEGVRAHWQGHRRFTRRVIEAFPDDKLFAYQVGGMRPLGVMVRELLSMGAPTVRGIATGQWDTDMDRSVRPKAELLAAWDRDTVEIDERWPSITGKLQERMTAFGQYTDLACNLLLYIIDNEIHHRSQGYVYLRALGIEPPPFYVRD